jgi:hypothetical protein
VVFSLGTNAPQVLPTNYTQYRRIGSCKTNGSSQWTNFVQDGDLFEWVVPVTDSTTVPTTATLRTINTPLGVSVTARLGVSVSNAGSAVCGANHWSPLVSTTLPHVLSGIVQVTEGVSGTLNINAVVDVKTNTSSQIYNAVVGTVTSYVLVALAWIDSRGRNT